MCILISMRIARITLRQKQSKSRWTVQFWMPAQFIHA
jgi:hypothetical protein